MLLIRITYDLLLLFSFFFFVVVVVPDVWLFNVGQSIFYVWNLYIYIAEGI